MRNRDVYVPEQRQHELRPLLWFGHVQPVRSRSVLIKGTARFNNEGPAQAGPFLFPASDLVNAVATPLWGVLNSITQRGTAHSAVATRRWVFYETPSRLIFSVKGKHTRSVERARASPAR